MQAHGRYELKYVVTERQAASIARFVQGYMRPSQYNRNGTGRGYPVLSLYLDSPAFHLLRQVSEGHKNRFKLRIRFYDDDWGHAAFLEIKRRVGEVTRKMRSMITREGARELLCGGWPRMSHWPQPGDLIEGERGLAVYDRFWRLCAQLRAQGMVYVSYFREAYEAPSGGELRVTFDREVAGAEYDGSGRLAVPRRGFFLPTGCPPYHFPHDAVILELKFDHGAPSWMYDLVRSFGLQRQSVCKYLACMEATSTPWGKRPHPSIASPLSMGSMGD